MTTAPVAVMGCWSIHERQTVPFNALYKWSAVLINCITADYKPWYWLSDEAGRAMSRNGKIGQLVDTRFVLLYSLRCWARIAMRWVKFVRFCYLPNQKHRNTWWQTSWLLVGKPLYLTVCFALSRKSYWSPAPWAESKGARVETSQQRFVRRVGFNEGNCT